MNGRRIRMGEMGALALAGVAATLSSSCAGAKAVPEGAPAHERTLADTQGGASDDALRFEIAEGSIRNYFFRQGDVAAHLVVSSGEAPRIIAAFPAGNTGLGLWFEKLGEDASLRAGEDLAAVEDGGLRGATTVVTADAPSLRVEHAILSSVRVLRDYTAGHETPASLAPKVAMDGESVVLRRTSLDGEHHYELRLEPVGGSELAVDDDGGITVSAPAEADELAVRLTALHDEPPLAPIPMNGILTVDAGDRLRDLQALTFLAYDEKLLAGSWRFLTYFGRDTLMSVRLLMPVLQPAVVEGGLRSVLERLSERGAVAHEEDIGEFAALRRLDEGGEPTREPIYDYKMIDDDFMLAPVVAEYLLDTEAGRERAEAFLAEETTSGETHAAALRRNLDYVLERATPYAENPTTENLIALLEGSNVGEWRDSEAGLGWGRIPYNVSGILVPAALQSAARLYESPLFGEDAASAARARELAEAWAGAPEHFEVTVPVNAARARIAAYAEREGFDPAEALESLEDAGEAVTFPGVALDEDGEPLPIMHSDDGFLLLLGSPDEARLEAAADRILRPFPAGLRTPVGVVVANPALAGDDELASLFGRDAYHGAVIWSWQQAMLAAGLERQLARSDLPDGTRDKLQAAQRALWDVISATEDERTTELWSWAIEDGSFVVHRSGQGSDTESNAAQLWSTVYLSVRPPAR